MSARIPKPSRYELGAPLGRGASGVVYEASDRKRGGTVAVKMLDNLDPKTLFALKNEFRSLADTVHPNLATLHELVCEDEHWYLSMELVGGGDFLSYVRLPSRRGPEEPTREAIIVRGVGAASSGDPGEGRAGRVSGMRPVSGIVDAAIIRTEPAYDERRVREATRQLAEGLLALHRAGKVHRDIKPSNVLVRVDGSVAIVDFGLVQSASNALSASPSTAAVAGTPLYVAPEVLTGEPNAPASDWYAVGVMLYEALTGEPPYGGGAHSVLFTKVQRDPVPIDDRVASVPRDLVALCEALMQRNPRDRPSGARVVEMLGGAAGSDTLRSGVLESGELFVGRLVELRVMRAAFDDVASNSVARTLIIRGRSGIGKTRLVESFVSEIRADPSCVVLEGRCYERETVPFKAMDTVVDALSSFLMAEPYRTVEPWVPANIGSLLRAFPVLERVRAIADARTESPRNVDPARLRAQAFDALRSLLRSVADHRALVIRLDDVQWGDGDSATMLAHVLTGPDAPSLLLLACHRDGNEDDGVLLRALRDSGRTRDSTAPSSAAVQELVLDAMSTDDTATVVRNWLPDASTELVTLVEREADGIPFFVCALSRYLRQHDEARAALESGTLGIRNVLGQSHDELDETTRRVLATVCLATEPLHETVVERAVEIPRERAVGIWKRLRTTHFIRALGGEGEDEIEPYHGRIREFVLSRLDASARKDIHRAIATALEGDGSPEPALLAEHWLGAGDRARACAYTEAAAQRASDALAFDRAARLYRTAIELCEDTASAYIRKLTLAMGDALANAGRGARAAPLFMMVALDSVEAPERLELERRAAEQWLFSGHLDQGLRVLEDVLSSADLERPAGTLSMLGELAWKRGMLAFRSLEKVSAAHPTTLQRLRIDACRTGAWALSTVDLLEGSVFQARQVALALDSGDPHRVVLALGWHAAIVGTSGPSSRASATRFLEAARRLLAGRDDAHGAAFVDLCSGTCAVMSGDYLGGLELLRRADKRLADECRGVAWEVGIARLFTASCLTYLGRFRELSLKSAEWLADARQRGDLYASTNMVLHESTTLLAIAADDVDGARIALDEAFSAWTIAPGTSQDFYRHLLPSYLDLYEGDAARARARLHEFFPRFRRSPFGQVIAQQCQLRYVRALADLACADAGGLRSARADAKFLARAGMPFGRVTAAMIRACLASHAGDVRAQASELRVAIAEATTHELMLFGAVSELALADLEVAATRAVDSPVREHVLGRLRDEGIADPRRFARLWLPSRHAD